MLWDGSPIGSSKPDSTIMLGESVIIRSKKLVDVGVICVGSFIIWNRLLFEIMILKDDLNSLPGGSSFQLVHLSLKFSRIKMDLLLFLKTESSMF